MCCDPDIMAFEHAKVLVCSKPVLMNRAVSMSFVGVKLAMLLLRLASRLSCTYRKPICENWTVYSSPVLSPGAAALQ